MHAVELHGVTKTFGAHVAVDDVSLIVPRGGEIDLSAQDRGGAFVAQLALDATLDGEVRCTGGGASSTS